MNNIDSPVALWRELCTSAGLELRLKGGGPGRDFDIEDTLRTVFSVPTEEQSFEAWLLSDAATLNPTVSTEQLMIEVLKSQSGFSKMLQDILDTLIVAQATQSSQFLSIEFKFDTVSDPIKNTLEDFRKTVQRIERVIELRPKLPNDNILWMIDGALHRFVPRSPELWRFEFPSLTAIPATGHTDLDRLLSYVARLVDDFVTLWKIYGENRDAVRAKANQIGDVAGRPELFGQLNAASDSWDWQVLHALSKISMLVREGKLAAIDVSEALHDALRHIENSEVWAERTIQELLDILELPVWKRRHELFSVWVGTRLLTVAKQATSDLLFHLIDGKLSFEFGGSRLATFNWDGKQFDIWAELRSNLVGKSTKRKKGIQPDFRVLKADISQTANEQTTYVLECKHYLSASASNFTQAATDYARSCPDAIVHVVNHGPVDEVALNAYLPNDLQPQTRFIGNATPLQEAETKAVARAIHEALFPEQKFPGTDIVNKVGAVKLLQALASKSTGYVALEWDDTLEDMDLSLHIIGMDGSSSQLINFSEKGDLEAAPFVRLSEDIRQGPGVERIDFGIPNFGRYELVATDYSQSGRMTPQALQCHIVTNHKVTSLRPTILSTAGHEWRIARLSISDGEVTVFPHEFSESLAG